MAEESPLVESPLSASVPLPESEYVGGMERENNVEIKREAPENDSNDKTDVLAVKALSNSDVANLILKIGRVVLPRAMMERNFKRMLTKLNLKDEGDYIGNYKIPRKALVYGLVAIDDAGNQWNFALKRWVSQNNKPIFALENTKECLAHHDCQQGDIMTLWIDGDNQLRITLTDESAKRRRGHMSMRLRGCVKSNVCDKPDGHAGFCRGYLEEEEPGIRKRSMMEGDYSTTFLGPPQKRGASPDALIQALDFIRAQETWRGDRVPFGSREPNMYGSSQGGYDGMIDSQPMAQNPLQSLTKDQISRVLLETYRRQNEMHMRQNERPSSYPTAGVAHSNPGCGYGDSTYPSRVLGMQGSKAAAVNSRYYNQLPSITSIPSLPIDRFGHAYAPRSEGLQYQRTGSNYSSQSATSRLPELHQEYLSATRKALGAQPYQGYEIESPQFGNGTSFRHPRNGTSNKKTEFSEPRIAALKEEDRRDQVSSIVRQMLSMANQQQQPAM